ncbi:uncharacterized protein C19orf44 homolog isoform X2 [Entelurus aequoreus]|uniref:uncharacterized protein C19orf44 homolog isoform X2 n=1 Tax=Entelurus aequoreus TaxID=161455 RepID=UPI002B1D97C6|nr:uncharacterized protein C19orf44 homolog isoform X2 [Entelurus aequoreus]
MWRRGGRSEALERAQALLWAKSSRAADANSRHAAPDSHQAMSDLSDVSQVSSPSEVRGATGPEMSQQVEASRPQSPVGGGSRFLKRPPPPPSSQSPVRQQSHDDRLLSKSQTSALRKLAQIESQFYSRHQEPEPLDQIHSPSSDVDLSSPSDGQEVAPVSSGSPPSSQGEVKKRPIGPPEDSHEGGGSSPPESSPQTEKSDEDVKNHVEDCPPDEKWISSSFRSRAGLTLTRRDLKSVSPSPPHSGGSPSSSSPPLRRPTLEVRLLPSPSPTRSDSSRSAPEEILSLEELFPVGSKADVPPSEASSVSSQSDFEINVMTLDDLEPATEGAQSHQAEGEHAGPLPTSPSGQRAADYESDFESASRKEVGDDVISSQVSEHLSIGEEVEDCLDASWVRTEDLSSTFSDSTNSRTLRTSGTSHRFPSSESRSSSSPSNHFKDVAAQTDAHTLWFPGPAVGVAYSSPSTAPPEGVRPDMLTFNNMLRQQLAMTRRFIESSRHQHASLLQSLGPPSYRYATLEDTVQYIRDHTQPE